MTIQKKNEPVGREGEGVDDVASLQAVQVLAFVQVPQHGDTVLASRSTERTIWRDSDGGDVAGVTEVVGAELAFGKFPDLCVITFEVSRQLRDTQQTAEN